MESKVSVRRSARIRAKMEEEAAAVEGHSHSPLLPGDSTFPSSSMAGAKSVKPVAGPGSGAAAAAAVAAKAFTFATLGFVALQIFCEVSKQLSNYSIQYYNGGRYPIPQTTIVVLMELIKLVTTVGRAGGSVPSFSATSVRSSLRFLVPSVLYALNNNIYFLGLTLVPPPIWLILCSARTAITACIYKFWLRRPLTRWQFTGAFLIVTSIITAKVPDLVGGGDSGGINAVPVAAIGLALIASCNSVGAAVYTESLFKGGAAKGESFLDQQFWLYLYGMVVASFVHLASAPTYGVASLARDLNDMSPGLFYLLCFAMFIGSCGGLVTAAILKFLDNIVKEYSGNMANIVTAVFCSFLFPDKFRFTAYVVLSLCLLLTGIYLYETRKASPKQGKATQSGAAAGVNQGQAKS